VASQAARRLAALDVAKGRLSVGRLDLSDGGRWYVGRLAVADETGDPMLIDWRAPAAAAFYQAVPGDPMGVVRRRHFRWRGDGLVGLDDEVLDAESARRDGLSLVGEGALLAALSAPRTGRMSDVVATIQAEQDRVIRRPRPGVLVVQGGPGTGKTAVALHRAAYLLYAEHASLRGQAILFVGPNATFLRYVEEVVPSLGEDRVVLAAPSALGPDVPLGLLDSDAAARLKGDARMAAVLAKAVADRERVPKREVAVPCGRFVLRLQHDDLRRIVARARRASGPHNARRRLAERGVLALLQQALDHAVARSVQHAGIGSRSDAVPVDELVDRRRVAEVVDAVWPLLTPERLLRFLYGAPRRLVRAGLSDEEALLLERPSVDGDDRWSEADVALLDELDVLLGPLPRPRPRPRRRAITEGGAMVDRILGDLVPDCPRCGAELTFVTSGGEPGGDRLRCDRCNRDLRAGDVMGDAAAQHLRGVHDSLVASSAEEPTPPSRPGDMTYGHVVIDEAQDLSAMQWRAVARRCPSLSMTIAGDQGQAIRPGGTSSWEAAAEALGAADHEVVELTVNYRAPAEVMEAAVAVLAAAGISTGETRSVRSTRPPRVDVLDDIGVEHVRAAVAALDVRGTVAVIAPEAMCASLRGLDAEVLDVLEAKGLEFDAVVVVDPDAIAEEGEGGARRVYVAMTRTTDVLHVLQRRRD
ncbi:MAG: helicase, superfamily, partial [Actinomycetia bacterium]|nr:helicase, superfamily [Actinomycetes bacterium]